MIRDFVDVWGRQLKRFEPKEFAVTVGPETRSIVFFVKGNASFRLRMNESIVVSGEQLYGPSYQMFAFDVTSDELTEPIIYHLQLEPSDGNESIHVVGPFTFSYKIESITTVPLKVE